MPVSDTQKCPHCGAANAADWVYFPEYQCGTPVRNEDKFWNRTDRCQLNEACNLLAEMLKYRGTTIEEFSEEIETFLKARKT